ncbi:hypothetical protein ABMA28_000223 [Loxostege sticticalis]|uniref:Histone H2A C-terminal domain-containing protein n=1 Tax=Loxostege sticticalis TaxID=481309 RepID=A0ABD0TRG7_LOXSC
MTPPVLTKTRTRSSWTGLQFPVGRIDKILREGNFAPQIGSGAYLPGCKLAANTAKDNHKSRVVPRHIVFAIRNDEELNRMLRGATISQGGLLPSIQPQLLPQKNMKSAG